MFLSLTATFPTSHHSEPLFSLIAHSFWCSRMKSITAAAASVSPCTIKIILCFKKRNKVTQRSLTSIYQIRRSDVWMRMLMRRRKRRRTELLWCQGDCGDLRVFNPLIVETLQLLLGFLIDRKRTGRAPKKKSKERTELRHGEKCVTHAARAWTNTCLCVTSLAHRGKQGGKRCEAEIHSA